MLRRYATEKEIIDALTDYKVGDLVTLMKGQGVEEGWLNPGTIAKIIEIEPMRKHKIYVDELDELQKNNNNFIYKMSILDSDVVTFLRADEFVKGKISEEQFPDELKKWKRAGRNEIIKVLLSLFVGYLVVSVLVAIGISIYNVIKFDGLRNVTETIVISLAVSIFLTGMLGVICGERCHIKPEKEGFIYKERK